MRAPAVNEQIAVRLRQLRAERSLSLEAVAEKSGVSRSMVSLIERAEASPTAVVLDKLASAFDIPLASLFESPSHAPDPVSRKAAQTVWRDPASGYIRRNVSPSGRNVQIVEIRFPPGAHVAYEGGDRPNVQQQIWILDGAIEITVGSQRHELSTGDCLAFALDRPTAFRNRGRKTARYALILSAGAGR